MCIDEILPALEARMLLFIFMASNLQSSCPTVTSVFGCTEIAVITPGIGARTAFRLAGSETGSVLLSSSRI